MRDEIYPESNETERSQEVRFPGVALEVRGVSHVFFEHCEIAKAKCTLHAFFCAVHRGRSQLVWQSSSSGWWTMWVCLKMLCTPLYPMVLLIIIPFLNGYFIGNIPYFQTNPCCFFQCDDSRWPLPFHWVHWLWLCRPQAARTVRPYMPQYSTVIYQL